MSNEVKLNEIGTISENCKVIDLVEGDSVKQVSIYYSTNIDQLTIKTIKGSETSIGKLSADSSVKDYDFDLDNYRFFGLLGTESVNVNSLGVIRYNFGCLEAAKDAMGDNFGWYASTASE